MSIIWKFLLYVVPVLLAYFLSTVIIGDIHLSKISILYPYFMLLTSDRQANLAAWQTHAPINDKIFYPPRGVPEILAKDYSFEVIKAATDNFRRPAVVKGLFKDSIAVQKWKTEEHLAKKLGEFTIPIVRNAVVGTLQDHRELVNFEVAFRELLSLPSSKEYLFFPVKSRFTFNGSAAGRNENLQTVVDELCFDDLNLDLIWPGFGTKRHTTFAGSQFVIGKSTEQFTNETTGSDWHCAIGNNWFVLVTGRKKWSFVEPQYSHYMSPLKGGMFNMWTGNTTRTASNQQHIPVWTTIMEEGDLLYNPDWMWHKVTNFGGLSIGVPIREKNLTLSFRNNPYFSSIVVLNTILAKFDTSLGGFPPPSAATEQDN